MQACRKIVALLCDSFRRRFTAKQGCFTGSPVSCSAEQLFPGDCVDGANPLARAARNALVGSDYIILITFGNA